MALSNMASKVAWGAVAAAVSLWPVVPTPTKIGPREHGSIKLISQRLKGGPIECTSENPELAYSLTQGIAHSLERRASRASVVLYDRTTQTYCTYGADRHYDSASTVKPIVLGALLMTRGTHLADEERDLARKMIVSSDNEATYALWDSVGPETIQKFLDRAGMKDTTLNEAGLMGLTQVTARDQARLLELLTGDDDSVLDAEERAYVLRLMHDVRSDQRWGTPAGAPLDAAVQVKNGWLQRSSTGLMNPWDRGDWKVNSMSAFTGRSYDYGLVVLTENNRVPEGASPDVGWDYGMDTIEGVAKVVHHDLHPDRTLSAYRPSRPL